MALLAKEITSKDIKVRDSNRIEYSLNHVRHMSPGTGTDFEWKDYCPSAFRLILELEVIDHDDYTRSICTDETLRKVSTGKPGNLFYLSDDRFIIKILRKSEIKVILEMLPSYYRHFQRYRSTILLKIFGAHVVNPVGGAKIYFAVMPNALQSDISIHRVFDLKGSPQGRKPKTMKLKERNVLKDLDLGFCFYLDPLVRHRLLKQIKFDCEFLEAEGIMDYSLMLGLHIKGSPQGLFDDSSTISNETDSICQDFVDSMNSNLGKMAAFDSLGRSSESNQMSSAILSPGSVDGGSPVSRHTVSTASIDSSGLTVAANSTEGELSFGDIWLQSTSRPWSKFGLKMPARAVRTSQKSIRTQKWYDAILYVRIVDTFQNYGVRKRIEHCYKSIQYDSKLISAVNPKAYSSRFQEFLRKIFLADDSDH